MWRRNALMENHDSDHSISEEEDLDGDWTGNAISLCAPAAHQGTLQMPSKFEILRDIYELHPAGRSSASTHEEKTIVYFDDEIENPLVEDEDNSAKCPTIIPDLNSSKGIICPLSIPSLRESEEEIISDDEIPTMVESLKEASMLTDAKVKTDALVCVHENSGSSSSRGVYLRGNNTLIGGKAKFKPKFSFHAQSCKEDSVLRVNDGRERASVWDKFGPAGPRDMAKSMAGSQLFFHDKESKQLTSHMAPSELARGHGLVEHSMAESLDCFQEETGILQQNLKMVGLPNFPSSALLAQFIMTKDVSKKGTRAKMVAERNLLQLGNRNLDDDDLPEDLYGSPLIPIGNEENPRSLNRDTIRPMVDQFHEAYGTMSEVDERSYFVLPRPLSTGLFGKLQQVIQNEKERDMAYLKSLSEFGSGDDGMCILVRILSKCLEAKLTVCTCSFVEHGETSNLENDLRQRIESSRRTLTIIFSSRICSDVELDVGSQICIHPPWKEIPVKGKDDLIILCSYFSKGQS